MMSNSLQRLLLLLPLLSSLVGLTKAGYQEDYFQELRFRSSVEKAMRSVAQILETTRHPRLAQDEDHVYEDKYALAEFLTNTVIAAEMNTLEASLGFTKDVFDKVWTKVHDDKKSVTMRFQAEKTTRFLKDEEVSVVTGENEVEEVEITESGSEGSSFWGGKNNEKTKTVKTKIRETVLQRHWKVGLKIQLVLFFGADTDHPIELLSRNSSRTFVTSGSKKMGTEAPPSTDETTANYGPSDINLTWLMQMISREKMSQFSINRDDNKTCKTPRRNEDVDAAVKFLLVMEAWASQVVTFFQGTVARMETYTTAQSKKYQSFMDDNHQVAESLFLPTLPLLENSTVLSDLDLGRLLNEQARRIDEANNRIESTLDDNDPTTLISAVEAKLIVASIHLKQLVLQYRDSINYIEDLLKNQLKRAIGKELTASDFESFMRSHYQKLFGSDYAPKLFSYAVRRPNHHPDGILSIEGPTVKDTTVSYDPAQTFVRQIQSDNPESSSIYIPINAATSVEIKGDRYLHGWLQHRFNVGVHSGQSQFRLAARAHQFSNFLLVVGTMAGPDKFQPSSAIVLQNKDEVLIPLITEIIPSAKEFKDAISSLSPEQQAFAKAFRASQLASSLFGVCVIQLKPQLEKLLGLPSDTLTKEIKLTQDLMNLFVEYQIPSDLLSVHHELSSSLNATVKLDSVKSNVRAVMDVIEQAKEEIRLEEKRKAEVKEQMYPSASPSASPSGSPSRSPSASPSSSPSSNEFYASTTSSRSSERVMPRAARSLSTAKMDAVLSESSAHSQSFAGAPPKKSASYQEGSIPEPSEEEVDESGDNGSPESAMKSQRSLASDFTLLPKLLDSLLEKHDQDGSLRSTIVKARDSWTRTRKENLLTPSRTEFIGTPVIETEKKKAFDLLDALSRSGSLPIEQSELHIVVVLSHCFEDDLISTIVKDNINPIEKAEKSSLLVASTVHGQAVNELIGDPDTLQRLTDTFPAVVEASTEIAAQAA
ncbi:expressed unknown protein [Seminavis robusta]|uniref:Uncharacterized protein n=1 Tax=Seminavis robusta TaxID=568900 RepID=A0A9N8H449_9STRA|nr:expressed unknown protein [Seminavis robusta]|eukprot:Sro104_g052960.1 n/a (991) ;mRNA; r:86345-89390